MAKEFNDDRCHILKNAHRELGIDFQLQQTAADLHEMRENAPTRHDTARLALAMFPASHSDIAKERGVSKVAIWKQMRRVSVKYLWIESLICPMAAEV
ncbi:hypothetical protein P0136_10030 [Lentisphaerota bacterium ZTH]|nr:hypothetical protein JYG24_12455 [Lentisphaerota bacterium]WET05700.1 hypothetical protein P0136_10030 [Lentisphaerota bacterium ZTH]